MSSAIVTITRAWRAEAKGQGAVTYKGRLIDIASARQAQVIVRMAELIAG